MQAYSERVYLTPSFNTSGKPFDKHVNTLLKMIKSTTTTATTTTTTTELLMLEWECFFLSDKCYTNHLPLDGIRVILLKMSVCVNVLK